MEKRRAAPRQVACWSRGNGVETSCDSIAFEFNRFLFESVVTVRREYTVGALCFYAPAPKQLSLLLLVIQRSMRIQCEQ